HSGKIGEPPMTICEGVLASESSNGTSLPGSADASSLIATPKVILAMLESGKGTSDLLFTPGRPPQVEKHGSLESVVIPELPALKGAHTRRNADGLIAAT